MTMLYFDTRAPLASFPPAGHDAEHRAEPPVKPPSWRARLRRWRETSVARRRLLRCAERDPRLAADIGLTPGDLAVERRLPFWVPVRRR